MLVRTAQDAMALFEPIFAAAEQEQLAIAHLDRERRLIVVSPLAASETDADLPMRAILSDALRLGAEALILARSHPQGDPTPSESDLAAARELAETARRLGIQLVDYLLVAGGEWRSMREIGLL